MLDLILLVAVVAVVGAVVFALLWRRAESGLRAREAEKDGLEASMRELELAVQKERKARSRQAEELAELRKRTDKAKRRQGKGVAQPMGTASRIQDLEEAGEKAALERDRLRAERDGLVEELAKLRTRIEVEVQARAKQSKPVAVAITSPDPVSTTIIEASLTEAKQRIGELESEAQLARQTEARLRKRMDNQDQLYASLRSELEVKKDRLRTQEEQLQRLQALKVAVLD